MLLKNNSWLTYYALIILSATLLIANIYSKYDELIVEKKYEQLYVNKIVSADIDAMLLKYETIIDLINEDFRRHNSLNQPMILNILEKSELLTGFALYNLDGTLRTKSDNISDKIYELKAGNFFYNNFSGEIHKDRLMISKAIYSHITKKWIIPIRKVLLDEEDESVGFMSSAIILEKLKQKWSLPQAFGNTITLSLDPNFYQLLHTNVESDQYQQFYQTPITGDQIENIKDQLKIQHLTLDNLRETGDIAQLILNDKGEKILHTMSYNKHYQFWTQSSQPLSGVVNQLVDKTLYYLATYIIFLLVTFFLFRKIVKIETSKLVELTYQSEHDVLTGCYNRTVLTRFVKKLTKAKKHFSLLYIDLDNFKNINDSFGHKYGDILLKEVSRRLQKSLDDLPGTLIRYSGDEFILLVETSNKEIVRNFTITLLNNLSKFHSINETSFSVTSSIGITRYPEDSKSLDTLISYAENSMAIAKKVKNQYLFFSQKVHQQLIKQAQIEQALHHAIDEGEISMVYQPQLDHQQNLYGVEALVRWHSKELGFIPPTVFIPIAEETGLMPKLGLHIMNTAISEIATLQKRTDNIFALSVNVSVRQFVQANFFESLMASIQNFGSKKLPITIEITESLFIESLDVLLPIFLQMKANNISLALDDFGTGYSSLSMLRDAPIDELKIDKSFVDHITSNKTDQAMVKSIINMGKNLDMRVLAEGVETAEHSKILEDSGCDLFQGYYFSHPLKIQELETFAKQLKDNKFKQKDI